MKRLLFVFLSVFLVAASVSEVVPQLESDGYYIEPGSSASEDIVSNAVFEGRSAGGRLYMVVLSEEPPGGAPTFSDSVLDELGDGYVVTVAPETVGFAGDGSFWSSGEMNDAIDLSLAGDTDDEVVELFISELTGGGVAPPVDDDEPGEATDGGGGSAWIWLVLIAGGAVLVFTALRRGARQRQEMATRQLEEVRSMAREKLDEIANDIIELEDEVDLSGNADVKSHYQRASVTYSSALSEIEGVGSAKEMVDLVAKLDAAIWELDAAEALLDGKPVPPKPAPPEPKPEPKPESPPRDVIDADVDRRPQRQSSYAGDDLMTALWAVLAMTGRGPGGFGGIPGGFGGPMRGGGGGSRMGGGGRRMGGGGGRMRGGGRRG
jgi:hypothetical protein